MPFFLHVAFFFYPIHVFTQLIVSFLLTFESTDSIIFLPKIWILIFLGGFSLDVKLIRVKKHIFKLESIFFNEL